MFFEGPFKCNCSTARREKNIKNKIKRVNQGFIAGFGRQRGNLAKLAGSEVGHSAAGLGCMLKEGSSVLRGEETEGTVCRRSGRCAVLPDSPV